MEASSFLDDALAPLDGAQVLVGFSGGLDSTVLLHALSARRGRLGGLRAIHVDHGLQAASGDWSRHCARACAELGVPLQVREVRVVPRGDGPEAAARRARMTAFADALGPGEALVLAHHLDDQAETVLLRLLRGAGGAGVAAMRDARPFARGVLRRPLLGMPRAALQAYARDHALSWIQDPSNAGTCFDRNYLRHEVLPRLHARWPGATQALGASARLLAEDAALLDEECARRLRDVALDADGTVLRASALRALSAPWRARVLRHWLQGRGLPTPAAAAHARIDAELLGARPDAVATIAWPGVVLRRWRDGLHAEAPGPDLPAAWEAAWDGAGPLRLPDGSWLDIAEAEGVTPDPRPSGEDAQAAAFRAAFGIVHVRPRAGGERLRLPGRAHRHQLKHLLQDAGIAPWLRARLPLSFAEDGELLAAGDALVGARLAAWQAEHGRRLRWRAAARD
jgi:tRNA(Ile)-lysidine synthase